MPLSRNSARELEEEKEYRDPIPSQKPRKQRRVRAEPSRKQAPTRNKPSDIELEKKLQFLKGLYEKNLVDEEEYNRKRKELLDTFL